MPEDPCFLFILTPRERATTPAAKERPTPAEAACKAGADPPAAVNVSDVAVSVAATLVPLDWAETEYTRSDGKADKVPVMLCVPLADATSAEKE